MSKILNRNQLVDDYVTRVIDGMDMDTLVVYAHDKMREAMDEYTDEQLLTEIEDYYPDLLNITNP